jgi:hypothetical protein
LQPVIELPQSSGENVQDVDMNDVVGSQKSVPLPKEIHASDEV